MIACREIPHCKVCSGMAWLKSCKRCEKGWYKHTGEYDIKARCVKKCPRGYQGQNSKRGAFCKKVTPGKDPLQTTLYKKITVQVGLFKAREALILR